MNDEPVEAVCASTGMTRDAVHAWRSRLGKLARAIASEVEGAMSRPAAPPAERTMANVR